jgi:hypothetical protein
MITDKLASYGAAKREVMPGIDGGASWGPLEGAVAVEGGDG